MYTLCLIYFSFYYVPCVWLSVRDDCSEQANDGSVGACNFWSCGGMRRKWICWWGWDGWGRGGFFFFSLWDYSLYWIGVCLWLNQIWGCVWKCIVHLLFLPAEVTYVKLFYCVQYTLLDTYPIQKLKIKIQIIILLINVKHGSILIIQ
jgi:hypothetical protein